MSAHSRLAKLSPGAAYTGTCLNLDTRESNLNLVICFCCCHCARVCSRGKFTWLWSAALRRYRARRDRAKCAAEKLIAKWIPYLWLCDRLVWNIYVVIWCWKWSPQSLVAVARFAKFELHFLSGCLGYVENKNYGIINTRTLTISVCILSILIIKSAIFTRIMH